MKTNILIATLGLALISLNSCVSSKKYGELQDKYDKLDEEKKYLTQQNEKLETKNKEFSSEREMIEKGLKEMSLEMENIKSEIEQLEEQNERLKTYNADLNKSLESMKSGTRAENKKLLEEMIRAQEDLQEKEDRLKELERELDQRQNQLDQLSQSLEEKDVELQEREQKVKELQDLLKQKDQAVKELKDKVTQALLGFKDKGLTVEQKNGRIYVSMEAKLLFPSGSTNIDPEGKKALAELAKVLEAQNDITVVVEGHTDTDALSGSGCLKDNWDLSVMRSTAVVKYMLGQSKIDPSILTAAGRGEYLPIAENTSPEGKAKNRRIEIILTPNLDQLFNILEQASTEVPE
jgi:chemotaxis protein MotB